MKILQLIDTLNTGGAERMAVNISNVLSNNGHNVVLCASREKGTLSQFVNKSVSLECLDKKGTFDLRALSRLLQIIKKYNIHIVHAHSSSVFWAIAAKILIPKIKIIWHDHYGLGETLKDTDRKVYRWISTFLFAIISVNKNLQNWSNRNMRVNQDNIVFINNFAIVEEFPRNTMPGLIKIVCLANLRPQKDHHSLVRAIHQINIDHPEIKLQVIFAGLYELDSYYHSLIKLIVDLGLNDIINIIGSVENSSLLLANADIGVLSSVSEGLPISLLEYGMMGLPVVVTNVGQCAEVVNYGNAGKLVPPASHRILAESLIELITNENERIRFGKLLELRIKALYGPITFMNEYEKLLTKVTQQ